MKDMPLMIITLKPLITDERILGSLPSATDDMELYKVYNASFCNSEFDLFILPHGHLSIIAIRDSIW